MTVIYKRAPERMAWDMLHTQAAGWDSSNKYQ